VVILTASEDPASLLEADKLGLAGYVGKDQRLDGIVEALGRAASGEGRVDKAMLGRLGGIGTRPIGQTSVLDKLTAQEHVVLGCLADGFSTSEIVARLGISHTTVRSHIQAILAKLGVHSRPDRRRVSPLCASRCCTRSGSGRRRSRKCSTAGPASTW
jgi:two-component system, NarL family, nitrate/nitrite response regulator NarL